jgi:hypothetical protein
VTGKEKNIQVRKEYIGNTEKCKLWVIHRRIRREEERRSFLLF